MQRSWRAARQPDEQIPTAMKHAMIGLLAALTMLVLAPRAAAHDPVVDTSPANGDTVAAAPAVVEIEFYAAPQQDPLSGSIVGPDGGSWASAPVRVDGNRLLIPMLADALPGWYMVEFRLCQRMATKSAAL